MAKKNLRMEEAPTIEAKMISGVSNFFTKFRTAIIICAAVIVVAIIAAIIAVSATNNARANAQIKIASLVEEYSKQYSSETPDWSALTGELKSMVKGSSYPSVKAEYLLGLVYYEQGEYTQALDTFIHAYELNKGIYLAPLALSNAAAAADENGDQAKALELYNQIYDEYPESGLAAKALFNVARIYYQQGNIQLAQATFAQVADYYASSEYGKLALNLANVL